MGVYVWNLSRHLHQCGHRVQIVTRGKARATTYEVSEDIPIWRPPFLPLYPYHVHLHGLPVAKLCRKLAPTVDLFHLHSPLVPSIPKVRPLILTMHSLMQQDANQTSLRGLSSLLIKLQAPFSNRIENRLYRSVDRVSVVSPQTKAALEASPACELEPALMWNGVDESFFTPGPAPSSQSLTLLYVGRLAPGKGVEDLLKAFCLVKKRKSGVRLRIAGAGSRRRGVKRFIAENRLQGSVELLGHISDRTELLALYRSASVFILPSHHESLPTALLEAMSCGVPSIATSVGAVPDVIRDGVNALLVSPRRPQLLARALNVLLADQGLQQDLRTQGRETVKARFSWTAIAGAFVRQYDSLLAEHTP
jgi:glycosyltransferase involved in cell wall biosynthesis